MIEIKMEPLTLRVRNPFKAETFELPGGWSLFVPEIKVEAEVKQQMADYFVKQGVPRGRAERMFEEHCQDSFNKDFKLRFRKFLRYSLRWYYNKYHDAGGFDPRKLQWVFVPAENTGRRGKKVVQDTLREMRRKHEAAS